MLKNFTSFFYAFRRLFGVLLLLNAFGVQAQTTIVRWNFNSSSLAPSTGSGTIALIGGITATYAAGVPADLGAPNNGLNTTDYPLQNTSPKSAGISLSVNTTGFNNLRLKFYVRHSGSAAKK